MSVQCVVLADLSQAEQGFCEELVAAEVLPAVKSTLESDWKGASLERDCLYVIDGLLESGGVVQVQQVVEAGTVWLVARTMQSKLHEEEDAELAGDIAMVGCRILARLLQHGCIWLHVCEDGGIAAVQDAIRLFPTKAVLDYAFEMLQKATTKGNRLQAQAKEAWYSSMWSCWSGLGAPWASTHPLSQHQVDISLPADGKETTSEQALEPPASRLCAYVQSVLASISVLTAEMQGTWKEDSQSSLVEELQFIDGSSYLRARSQS
eukprot:3726990-Rhodomonas_salina.1